MNSTLVAETDKGQLITPENDISPVFILILKLSAFFVFAGRAWQHLFGDAPFRSILWDEGLMTGFVNRFLSMSWDEYATHPLVDLTIQRLVHATGIFYVICAIVTVYISQKSRLEKTILKVGAISLTVLSFLYCKEKSFQVGQFLEYAIQFGSPLFLVWALAEKKSRFFNVITLEWSLRIAVALTFVCHGLYAFGYYPVPGDFIDMTIQLLKVSDAQAVIFLKFAGLMDFAIGISMLTGHLKKSALGYAAFWGLGTAFARFGAYVTWSNFTSDSTQWLPEVLYRLSHGLIPMAAFILVSPIIARKLNDRLVFSKARKQATVPLVAS
ncbi:MAG: hypothetical protein V4736_09395 [Bdellovibrionota bacterium]